MEVGNYVRRHERVELEVMAAVRVNQKIAAKHLLKILNYVKKSDHEPVHIVRAKVLNMFEKMYEEIYKSIVEFGEDSIISNIKWESNIYENTVDKDKLMSKLFGGTLIAKHSLRNWLRRASFKNTDKVMSIMRVATIDDISKQDLEKRIVSYYKNPLNTIRSLIDAIAFSSLFIVRDAFIKKNDVKLIQWISVLDKGTTKGCIRRSELIYTAKGKKPHGHYVEWREPGVYHWGCRSFIIPYK